MELSAKIEYALVALIEIASHSTSTHPLNISDICAKQPIPERYLAEILTSLRRKGLIKSQRGAKGGYILARQPWEITVLEILNILEKDNSSQEKEHKRSESATIEEELLDNVWQQANQAAEEVLGCYKLQDLCQRRDLLLQSNSMYYI